jgi:hypothetical protein
MFTETLVLFASSAVLVAVLSAPVTNQRPPAGLRTAVELAGKKQPRLLAAVAESMALSRRWSPTS